MISEELLNEVMKEEFQSIYDGEMSINIYELSHKCKEWANIKNYAIETTVFDDGVSVRVHDHSLINMYMELDNVPTEPEAVFKACEWILKHEEPKR